MAENQAEDRALSAEDILNSTDLQRVKVYIQEWGGYIYLRTLTAGEAMEFVDAFRTDAKDASVKLLAMSACKEDGSRLFTSADSIEKLRGKSLKAIMQCQEAAMKLNGLDNIRASQEAAKNA
jgi:hypothetical protein